MAKEANNKSDKVVKVLQYVAIVLMVCFVVAGVWAIKHFGINLKNITTLADQIKGTGFSLVALAGILVAFSVVKSFALVFPPAVLYAVTGLLFKDNLLMAWGINLVGTACSLVLPYYLGRFTGKDLVGSLKTKFKAVKKIDDFAGKNDFSVVMMIKASGCMPSDVSSLVFGAMDISFPRYFLAANLGLIPLNICWTLFGVNIERQLIAWLCVFPILLFTVAVAVYMAKKNKKKPEEK